MIFEIRRSGRYFAKSADRDAIWQIAVVDGWGKVVAIVAERFGEKTMQFDSNFVTPVHAYAEIRDVE